MTKDPEARTQAEKFRDLARELEVDEDEAKFEETVKKMATPSKAEESDA